MGQPGGTPPPRSNRRTEEGLDSSQGRVRWALSCRWQSPMILVSATRTYRGGTDSSQRHRKIRIDRLVELPRTTPNTTSPNEAAQGEQLPPESARSGNYPQTTGPTVDSSQADTSCPSILPSKCISKSKSHVIASHGRAQGRPGNVACSSPASGAEGKAQQSVGMEGEEPAHRTHTPLLLSLHSSSVLGAQKWGARSQALQLPAVL